MTDRSSMDRPATAVAASLGVVLILASAALFILTGAGGGSATAGGNAYNVAWSQQELGSDSGSFGAQGVPSMMTTVTVDMRLASSLIVSLGPCDDDRGTPQQGAAQISWTVSNGSEEMDSGTATCADVGELATIDLAGHPDRAEVDAGSIDAARAEAWEGAGNYTAEYTLSFVYTRAAGPVPPNPLPVGQPSFSGEMTLQVQEWDATVSERPEGEVGPR